MGKGLYPKAISHERGVSVKTEETHQRHIKEKLHARMMVEVRRMAEQWVGAGVAYGEPVPAGC